MPRVTLTWRPRAVLGNAIGPGEGPLRGLRGNLLALYDDLGRAALVPDGGTGGRGMIVAVVVHPNAMVDAYGLHHQPLPDYSGPLEVVGPLLVPLYPPRLWRYEDARAWAVRRERIGEEA